jgi:hypothetical protein
MHNEETIFRKGLGLWCLMPLSNLLVEETRVPGENHVVSRVPGKDLIMYSEACLN